MVFGGIRIVFESIVLNVTRLFFRELVTFNNGVTVLLIDSVRSAKFIIQEFSSMKSEPINIVSDKLSTTRMLHSYCEDSGGNPIEVLRLPSTSSFDPFAPTKLVFVGVKEDNDCGGTIFLLTRVTGDPESARA